MLTGVRYTYIQVCILILHFFFVALPQRRENSSRSHTFLAAHQAIDKVAKTSVGRKMRGKMYVKEAR